MYRFRLCILLMFLALGCLVGRAQVMVSMPDSVPCLHISEGQDSLRFPGGHQAFDRLYARLDTLLITGRGALNILHVGASHVQGGFLSGRLRQNFTQMAAGMRGDRGMLFPYEGLHSHGPVDYRIDVEGQWEGCKCLSREPSQLLGLSGASLLSRDSVASLRLYLDGLQVWKPTQLRLLGQASNDSVQPYIVLRGDTINPLPSDGRPGYLFPFQLRMGDDTCTFGFRGIGVDSASFCVRGLLPQSASRHGITYSASGIIGANVPSWLRCSLFQQELTLLPPQLCIFGIGINDANVQTFDPEAYKEHYRQLIQRIQAVSPDCNFLFITNNDCWLNVHGRGRHRPNANTELAGQAMYQLATEYHGAVFDVYALMGGLGSSDQWVSQGLMRSDHIHFTQAGYQLLGDLLYNALVRDYQSCQISYDDVADGNL